LTFAYVSERLLGADCCAPSAGSEIPLAIDIMGSINVTTGGGGSEDVRGCRRRRIVDRLAPMCSVYVGVLKSDRKERARLRRLVRALDQQSCTASRGGAG
jgi:hypothetical protein